jgi:ADP-ribose pyrophosphatase
MSGSWRRLRSNVILSNQWLTVEKNAYLAGSEPIDDYFIIRRQPFVLVVPETDEGVILVRQYRPATERFYLSLPAGYIDPLEDVLAAAARELLEETGVVGRNFRLVGSLDPLPGYLSSAAHIVKCSVLIGTVPVRHDDEVDEVIVVPWSEIEKLIGAGHIDEMQAVAALLLVRLIGG